MLTDFESFLFQRELDRLQKECMLCPNPPIKEDIIIQIQLITKVLKS